MPQIELIPRAEVANTPWWKKLTPAEQRTVLLETQALTEEMVNYGMSRLAIGEHLYSLQEILEPKRIFTAYLRRFKNFSKSSAYRYIQQYLKLKDRLPEPYLRKALAMGYNVIDLHLVDKNSPEPTKSPTKIVAYLEKVAKRKRKPESEEYAPDRELLVQECVHFVRSRAKRCPSGNSRKAFYRDLGGMILWESGEDAFSPLEIPEEYRPKLGRPPKKDQD